MPQRQGKTNSKDIERVLESIGFVADQGSVEAESYELLNYSLKNHFRLLADIRTSEVASLEKKRRKQASDKELDELPNLAPKYRVMGTLWYGNHYTEGFVIEVFGTDIKPHMIQRAHSLLLELGGEIPVGIRKLKKHAEYTDKQHKSK